MASEEVWRIITAKKNSKVIIPVFLLTGKVVTVVNRRQQTICDEETVIYTFSKVQHMSA
jgi:hypothetical protein